jgi:hypothetical protein
LDFGVRILIAAFLLLAQGQAIRMLPISAKPHISPQLYQVAHAMTIR